VIEFFPRAYDGSGNYTAVPEVPYALRILSNSAAISTPLPAYVAPGDEFWFAADLATANADAVVRFYYSERVLEDTIDASRVNQAAPYTSVALAPAMEGTMDPGDHAIITINDSLATYVADLTGYTTKFYWTLTSGAIEFAAPPSATDIILASYNITAWTAIASGDDTPDVNGFYTVAWSNASGTTVPNPANAATDAYDIVARMIWNDTDAVEDPECELWEPLASETTLSSPSFLYLVSEDAPTVNLYGIHESNWAAAYPRDNWPGNPLFQTTAGLSEDKLSGHEIEVFVTTDEPAATAGVNLIFSSTTPDTVAMTEITATQENVNMTFTLYESDFPDVPYDWENVTLTLTGVGSYPMALTSTNPRMWQTDADVDSSTANDRTVPVPVGATTSYTFTIDMVGDNHATVEDPRNNDGAGTSSVKVPDPATVSFWYASIDVAEVFGTTTSVHTVTAEATDVDGNVGTDGPYTFIYDPIAPVLSEVFASSERFPHATNATVYCNVPDPDSSFDAVTVSSVMVQYCPNYHADVPESLQVWLAFGTDNDGTDGWQVTAQVANAGNNDGYDNDGDGFDSDAHTDPTKGWDEDDESTASMAWRVIPIDDGHNYGAWTILPFTLDSTVPEATVQAPGDGYVWPFTGGAFTIAASITDSEEDIAYVSFQYAKVNATWPALPYAGGAINGHIDPTPEDDDDLPYVYDVDTEGTYEGM